MNSGSTVVKKQGLPSSSSISWCQDSVFPSLTLFGSRTFEWDPPPQPITNTSHFKPPLQSFLRRHPPIELIDQGKTCFLSPLVQEENDRFKKKTMKKIQSEPI